MSWLKKYFPTFHKAPRLMERRVPLWTHLPAAVVLLAVSFALVWNVNELASLRRAVVEQERIEAMTSPYGFQKRSVVFGMTVCQGNLLVRFADWVKGQPHCHEPGGGPGNGIFMDAAWCASAWNRWYYGGAGCPDQTMK